MSANASEFYQSIVDEVVESMRSEFINEGVSEDILEKLKKTWEQKIKSKSIDAQSSRIQEM